MCTKNDGDITKCFHFDSFENWCVECVEDWFEIISHEE